MRDLGSIDSGLAGPTLVVTGALHGNEPSGVIAIQQVIGELRRRRIPLRGRLCGMVGNVAALAESRRYLAPRVADLLHAQARDDLKRIEESQLATSFAIHEARVAPLDDGWRVSVRGARLSWSRSQFLGEDRVRYTVDVMRTPPSDLNPWGLHVSGLRLEREGPIGALRAVAGSGS